MVGRLVMQDGSISRDFLFNMKFSAKFVDMVC